MRNDIFAVLARVKPHIKKVIHIFEKDLALRYPAIKKGTKTRGKCLHRRDKEMKSIHQKLGDK